MTAEDRCKVCKDLLKWSENTDELSIYMEEGIYAVNMPFGRVMLVKAKSYREAERKAFFPTGEEEGDEK